MENKNSEWNLTACKVGYKCQECGKAAKAVLKFATGEEVFLCVTHLQSTPNGPPGEVLAAVLGIPTEFEEGRDVMDHYLECLRHSTDYDF